MDKQKEPEIIEISFSEFDGEKKIEHSYRITKSENESAYNIARFALQQRIKQEKSHAIFISELQSENRRLRMALEDAFEKRSRASEFMENVIHLSRTMGFFYRSWLCLFGWKRFESDFMDAVYGPETEDDK